MSRHSKIVPTPGYHYTRENFKVIPRADYKYKSLHTRHIAKGDFMANIDVEWCPVCLGRCIGEKLVNGVPKWYCKECGNEW